MSSSADLLVYHQPTLYLQRSGDYQWQLPAPRRDRRWQRRDRPYLTPQQPTLSHCGAFTEGSGRDSMSTSRSGMIRPRSSTAMIDYSTNDYCHSSSSLTHMSSPRDLHNMRSVSESIVSRSDRPESLTKTLVSKGYKLLRRQNSRSDLTSLRTMDWMEQSNRENTSRKLAKHSRWQSTDSGMSECNLLKYWTKLIFNSAVGIKHDISKPYNFQHLTHTHAKQVQELKRASHNELVSGFFAIRASQAPQQELKGIKAENLENKASQAEPLPQDLTDPITPPSKSPTRSQYRRSNSPFSPSGSLKYSRSIENFSQPSPRTYKVPTSPTGLPPRVSSRHFKHDQFTYNQDASIPENPVTHLCQDLSPTLGMASSGDDVYDISNAPHAVTTPDQTALTLRSFPFGSSGTELADVPEEDEHCARRLSSASGLRHSRSFPNPPSLSYRRSQTLPSTAGEQLDGPISVDARTPRIDQPFDEVPIRPRMSRRISSGLKGIDASWEEDIDYCYEHAAEADCDFDWERVPGEDEKTNDINRRRTPSLNVDSTLDDLINDYENICIPKSDRIDAGMQIFPTDTPLTHGLPPLQTLMPDLVHSSANSAKSPNSSIPSALTPAQLLPSPQSITLPAKGAKNFDFSPSLLIPKDYESQMLQEDVYEHMLDGEHIPEHHYPIHDLRYEASSSRGDSPRSSGTLISKCNSQDSIMYSSVLAMRRAREADSVGSLPELVHSKASQERSNDHPPNQVIATNMADASIDNLPGARHHRRSQSLAADIARQSILQKAASYSSLYSQDEDALPPVSLPSTKRRSRAHSDAATRILHASSQPSVTTLSRKRSASSGSALSGSSQRNSRASYTLFPPVPGRSTS